MELKGTAYEKMRDAYVAADEKNIPMFQKQLTEIRFTPEEIATFRKEIGEPLWKEAFVDEYGDKIPAQELLDFLLSEAEKAAGS